jgi:hypothetical protein
MGYRIIVCVGLTGDFVLYPEWDLYCTSVLDCIGERQHFCNTWLEYYLSDVLLCFVFNYCMLIFVTV